MPANNTQVTNAPSVNAKPNGEMSELDKLRLELAATKARLADVEAASRAKIKMAVSEKGAISWYGLGRFPLTLYRSQVEAIIPMFKDGTVERFIVANSDKLATKEK